MLMTMIRRLRIKAFHGIDGWLSENEAVALYSLARKFKNPIIVEIGSWQGKSTYCLARGMRGGTLYAIDPFNADGGGDSADTESYAKQTADKDLEATFRSNMERLGVSDRITVLRGYSKDYHHKFRQIDILFIDGDHSIEGCSGDYKMFSRHVARGGYIALHDYYPERPSLGPTHVIEQILKKDTRFDFYQNVETLWIARRHKVPQVAPL